jgi:hypothetical protein
MYYLVYKSIESLGIVAQFKIHIFNVKRTINQRGITVFL